MRKERTNRTSMEERIEIWKLARSSVSVRH